MSIKGISTPDPLNVQSEMGEKNLLGQAGDFLLQLLAIAHIPEPPYYAVIFTPIRTEGDNGYAKMAERMLEWTAKQSGFLGVESAREDVRIALVETFRSKSGFPLPKINFIKCFPDL